MNRNRFPTTPTVRAAGAGEYGGNCYRTACQQGGAVWFHHSTRYYYCAACAKMLNKIHRTEAMNLYGHDLLTLATPATAPSNMTEFEVTSTINGNGYRDIDGEQVTRKLYARNAAHAGELHEAMYPDDSIDLIKETA